MNRLRPFLYLFLLFAVAVATSLRAQDRIVINDSIEAEMQKGVIPVTINCDDPTLGASVRFALGAHGSISVRNGSSVKLNIGRVGVSATGVESVRRLLEEGKRLSGSGRWGAIRRRAAFPRTIGG
jgi:hypothetical protein